MKKKILCTMMSMVMVASLFAGCGTDSGTENSASDNSKTEETGQTTSDDPYAAYAGTTISVAAIETGYGSQMWQEVTDAFTEETGIQVELTTDKKLEDVIGPSMQGGEYPDVIHLATGREAALTEQFIKGNMITDITDVLSMKVPGEDKLVSEKIAGGFTDTSLTNPYGDGKTYLAPMFYSPCGLFYNAGLLEEKGWDVPTTWDEMWELGDKAKEEGIYLFTYPTTGYFDAFFYALMYAAGGPEFFDKATNYEEGIWETPEAQTCFDIVAMMVPFAATLIPLFKMFTGLHLQSTWIAYVLPTLSTPFLIMMFRQSARSFPTEIIEAARIDGLGELQIFFKIFMPTMKSTYAAAMTVTFMNAWNNYLWPKVIMMDDTSQTMPMLVANLSSGYSIDYGVLMLGVLICSLPTGILFLVLQKSFANGIVGAVKG